MSAPFASDRLTRALAGAVEGARAFVKVFASRGVEIFTRGEALFFVPIPPPKPRSHAADRTRSPRWRAGTRRHRRLARRGLLSRPAKPPVVLPDSWQDLGWCSDPGDDVPHV